MNGKGYTEYGKYERIDNTLILFATEDEAYEALMELKREKEEKENEH